MTLEILWKTNAHTHTCPHWKFNQHVSCQHKRLLLQSPTSTWLKGDRSSRLNGVSQPSHHTQRSSKRRERWDVEGANCPGDFLLMRSHSLVVEESHGLSMLIPKHITWTWFLCTWHHKSTENAWLSAPYDLWWHSWIPAVAKRWQVVSSRNTWCPAQRQRLVTFPGRLENPKTMQDFVPFDLRRFLIDTETKTIGLKWFW